jgi:BirA family biotin operon repressor/biotin-[acetyl-CoA-carboxylase] ligase
VNQQRLAEYLAKLPLGPIRYFDEIDSTNSEAARWIQAGAPDLALVIADAQTAGRGRQGRYWHTPAGAALAFSLVLLPEALPVPVPQTIEGEQTLVYLARLAALAALAVADGLEAYSKRQSHTLKAEIKWPNDVLVGGRKLAGVLAESRWEGESLVAVILGTGINVAPLSVPPDESLTFPATCVEAELGNTADRWELLHTVLESLLSWRERLPDIDFMRAWESRLAYKGEFVRVSSPLEQTIAEGVVTGLAPEGALRLRTRSGEDLTIHSGEVGLRPVDRSPK